jgi:hypothetical protein
VKQSGWSEEKAPKIKRKGHFEAWIVGTHKRLSGKRVISACAWEVRLRGENNVIDEDAYPSESVDSTQARGCVAAAIGVIDTIANGSEVMIYCSLENIVTGIEKETVPHENKRIWGRLFKTAKAKGIDLHASHRGNDDKIAGPIYERLKKLARKKRDERVRKLLSK